MIPDDALGDGPPAEFLPPDDVPKSRLIDLELGGVALNDPSQGHMVQVWRAYKERLESVIYVEPADRSLPPVPVVDTGTSEALDIGLSFDQNMRPVLCWAVGGTVFLYWYDGTIPGPTISSWMGRSPLVTLDDKRPEAAVEAYNDVLLFYMDGTDLKMRRQRDRYANEFYLNSPGPWARLRRAGMGRGLKLQIEVTNVGE